MTVYIPFNSSLTAKLAAALLAAATLGGCMSTDELYGDRDRPSSQGSTVYPITLNKGPHVLDVQAAASGLDSAQQAAVRAFIAGARDAHAAPLYISQSSSGGASARVAAEIASLAVAEGYPRAGIAVAHYKGHASGPVRISYASSRAEVRPCGTWPSDLTETSNNAPYENFGCAVQTNIAAMIENPDTVLSPAPVDPVRAASTTAAIERADHYVNRVTLPSNYGYAP